MRWGKAILLLQFYNRTAGDTDSPLTSHKICFGRHIENSSDLYGPFVYVCKRFSVSGPLNRQTNWTKQFMKRVFTSGESVSAPIQRCCFPVYGRKPECKQQPTLRDAHFMSATVIFRCLCRFLSAFSWYSTLTKALFYFVLVLSAWNFVCALFSAV